MQSEQLIQSLIEQTRQVINQVEKLQDDDLQTLCWRPNATSWSILECLEHLNLYGAFYLPEIETNIILSKTHAETAFKSGILGNYFAKSMLPREKLNKMKTFQDKNPLHAPLDKTVIVTFLAQQMTLLDLLSKSRQVSLNKVRIRTSISRFIRINLGDTFQFIIHHNLRHVKQIERIQVAMKMHER